MWRNGDVCGFENSSLTLNELLVIHSHCHRKHLKDLHLLILYLGNLGLGSGLEFVTEEYLHFEYN